MSRSRARSRNAEKNESCAGLLNCVAPSSVPLSMIQSASVSGRARPAARSRHRGVAFASMLPLAKGSRYHLTNAAALFLTVTRNGGKRMETIGGP